MVKLLGKVGQTSYPVDELPIEIVSLDENTVSFRIKQTILQAQVDHLYAAFDEPLPGSQHAYNPVCYEEQGVDNNVIGGDIYVAHCLEHTETPAAIVRVFVSDVSLPVEDNSKVPECCHATGGTENNVVKYTFEVYCACPETAPSRKLLRGSNR
jgi:hypothetical protein